VEALELPGNDAAAHTHKRNSGNPAVGQREVQDSKDAAKRQQGFWDGIGQRAKPFSHAPRHDERGRLAETGIGRMH